jgi:hypothetical protein
MENQLRGIDEEFFNNASEYVYNLFAACGIVLDKAGAVNTGNNVAESTNISPTPERQCMHRLST